MNAFASKQISASILQVDREVNAQFLGLVVSGFSIFQVIGAIMFGAWCQYRPAIEPLLAGASLRFIGNFLYLSAENYPGFDGKMLILFARLTVGFSAGKCYRIRISI